MNNKETEPKNSKGGFHGYQEWYWDTDCKFLWYRGKWKNGLEIGYEEYHGDGKDFKHTEVVFHIR